MYGKQNSPPPQETEHPDLILVQPYSSLRPEISERFPDKFSFPFPYNRFISKPNSRSDFKASEIPPALTEASAIFERSLPVTQVSPSPSHTPQRSNLALDSSFLSHPTG